MNWLQDIAYLVKGSSSYVQLAFLGARLIMKYAPPLFDLLSSLVDEGFDLIEAWRKEGKSEREAKELARENTVGVAMRAHPEIPETRIRAALEDVVELKKLARNGRDNSAAKESEGVTKRTINLHEIELAKQAYPKLFGYDE